MAEPDLISRRRAQFSLRQLLCLIALSSIAMGGWYWWRWLAATRHMRAFSAAIAQSDLSEQDKQLLGGVAWNQQAWDSGLIRDLAGPFVMKRIVWQSQFRDSQGQTLSVSLLDSFVRPVAQRYPMRLTCIVTDQTGRLLTWQSISDFSWGFLQASLDSEGLLTVTTRVNFAHAKHVHRYLIRGEMIEYVDQQALKFAAGDASAERPLLTETGPLRDIAGKIRKRELP